jgi:hypothetical protein
VNRLRTLVRLTFLLLPPIAGCADPAIDVAREAADRQAAQNDHMIRLQRDVSQGAERLIDADADARRELLAAHRRLQADQAELAAQFHQLDAQRQRFDAERRATITLAAALRGGGLVAVALATLAVVHRLLSASQTDDACAELAAELLAGDLSGAPLHAEPAGRLERPLEPPRLPET